MKFVFGAIAAALTLCSSWAQGSVNWSVLPATRTGAPNEDLTFLATIVNGTNVEMDCQPRFGGNFSLSGGARGQARFFTYDNDVVGDTANGLVAIPAGGRQDYIVVLSVDRAYTGNIIVNLECTDPDNLTANLRRIALVNDFHVVIEAGNPPDIIMIGDTLTNDGVARVGAAGPRAALMTMAAVNIGSPATDFVVVPDITGFSRLQDGYRPTICETDAAGICTGPEDTFVSIANWPTDEVRLFAVRIRVPPQNSIPFYPDQLRLRVRAAPDPETAALARPNELTRRQIELEYSFGNFGVAINAQAQPPFNSVVAPVQQCMVQVNGDTGGDFARSGGMLLFSQPEGAGGRISGEGYLEMSDGQFRTNDIELFLPVSLEIQPGSTEGTVTISGGGSGAPVESDVALDATRTTSDDRRNFAFLIAGTAQGGILEGRRDSTVRCAGVPPDDALDITWEEAFAAIDRMRAEPGINGETAFNFGEDDGEYVNGFYLGITFDDEDRVLEGFEPHRPDFPDLTEAQVGLMYDGSLSALRIASQVGYSGVFVPAEFDTSGETPVVRCGVLSFTGTTPTVGGDQDNQDADVVILLPIDEDPEELGDGECIQ